ncbi:hypothetical protein QF117_02640 [Vibrio sp. YMD68]|uniref:hypothetical protein n=1 Tax=Vibrio sp. YMD68 TaxID=3042300 RepID=UPI00249B6CB4|nr:hypothetical protein [Vibrio sp. YMD68]WGV98878.1 hypothetical protein QF117_02640 [Vibrio sp. YMD68]
MSESRTEEEQKRCNEIHDKYRDDLLKRQQSNSEGYDKAILSLSSASLGFSLTAIKFVVPLETATYMWLLNLGWALLLATIICSLLAYRVSNKALGQEMLNAEDYYINGDETASRRKNKYSEINGKLNKATGVFFAIAITFVVIFVMVNVNGDRQMSDQKNTTTRIFVGDSADVPRMQRVSGGKSAEVPSMQTAPKKVSGSAEVPRMQLTPSKQPSNSDTKKS